MVNCVCCGDPIFSYEEGLTTPEGLVCDTWCKNKYDEMVEEEKKEAMKNNGRKI